MASRDKTTLPCSSGIDSDGTFTERRTGGFAYRINFAARWMWIFAASDIAFAEWAMNMKIHSANSGGFLMKTKAVRVLALTSALVLGASEVWADGCGISGDSKYVPAPSGVGKSLGYIVQLENVDTPAQLANVMKNEISTRRQQRMQAKAVAGAAASSFEPLKMRHVFEHGIRGFSVENLTDAEAQDLAKDSRVKCVSPNHLLRPAAQQNLSSNSALWGLDLLDQRQSTALDAKYNYTYTGAGVHVYVVDSGIYSALAEFGGRVGTGYSPLASPQPSGQDCIGHGTKVAGIVGANTFGVAKNVTLHPVQVVQCNDVNLPYAAEDDITTAMNWISANATRPAVVNISLTTDPGTPGAPAMETAIKNAINNGIHVVVAGGNNDVDSCTFSPGRLSQTSAVINVSSLSNRLSRSSQAVFGKCVTLFAQGAGVPTTNLPTKPAGMTDVNYLNTSGTSFAAPFVTGVVAQMLEELPTLPPSQMKTRIRAYADGQTVLNAGTDSPQAVASVQPLTCSLTSSKSSVKAGEYFSLYSAGDRLPAGAKAYWYGTKNGVVDMNGVDGGPVPSTYTYANIPSDQGLYTRRMQIRASDGTPLCNTATISVELLPPPSCQLGVDRSVASTGQAVNYFVTGQQLPANAQGYWYGTRDGVTDANNVLAGTVPNTFTFVTQASWAGNYTRYVVVRDPASNATVCTTNSVSVRLQP